MVCSLINSFMKIFFHLLYHGMAGFYDLVAGVVSLGHWKDWIASALPHLDREPILELGHGPGYLQKNLLESRRFVFGLDESRQMSRIARKRLKNYPFCLMRADAGHLPLPARAFPLLVATFPSEYIFRPETLSEIHRVLKEDGKVVILLAAWPGGSSVIEKAVQLLFRVTGESPPKDSRFTNLTDLFSKYGFDSRIILEEFQKTRLLLISLLKMAQN